MIHKIHFGKRLSMYRRKKGISQGELAQKLGVTSQAVSKWECGMTIPDIDLLLELSHFYQVTINEMLEDNDIVETLTGSKAEQGIHYFISKQEPSYHKEWAQNICDHHWIERNWNAAQVNTSSKDKVGKKMAHQDGTILEIGAGPGGGYMPYILKANPDATIIISDLSPTVIREWKQFLDKTLDSPHIYYAVFDFCQMPFPDNSIDLISDFGGIANCIGDKSKALKEAYRVLKPGGKLITSTGFVTKETLASLPQEAQKVLLEKRPDIFEDLYEDTVLAGFHQIDSVIDGCWYTDDDDSFIADLARSLQINLKFTSYIRYCTKE